jgi:LysR family cys regulon transcriptional activator
MNLQQLRFIVEISRQGLSISKAAAALHTSQPGVSKQLSLLEQELGFEVFTRSRSRLTGRTAEGERVIEFAEKALEEITNIQRISKEYKRPDTHVISIATSHTQARYVLSEIMRDFAVRFPKVSIRLRLGNPQQITQLVLSGETDIGITTDPTDRARDLLSLPFRSFERMVIAPRGHELLQSKRVTLKKLAQYPLIAYEPQFTGWQAVTEAFKKEGLTPKVFVSAIDADVIKTCVEQGMGIAVLSEVTYDPKKDSALGAIRTGSMFAPATTNFLLHRKRYLPEFAYDFIETCMPAWTKAHLHKAIQQRGKS